MHDKVIEDPELEQAITEFLDSKDEAKKHSKAKAAIDKRLELVAKECEDGQIIRVGPYTCPVVKRGGGGFQVPVWEKNTIGKIAEA